MSAQMEQLAQLMIQKGLTLATAESCTGGSISVAITDLPGSSRWFNGGIISYNNAAKQHLLGVREISLKTFGAVSEAVVLEMAQGACRALHADVAMAVSGVAGPAGGSEEKPVGTVWICWMMQIPCAKYVCQHFQFAGGRAVVRRKTVEAAVDGCLALLR
jgi:nicotinamide-nucleotide amidase